MPPPALSCPRCATPLLTLDPGAAVGHLSVQCTRCGHWVKLGAEPGAGGAPAFGPPGRRAAGIFGSVMELIGFLAAVAGSLALAVLGVAQGMLQGALSSASGQGTGGAAALLARLPWLLSAVALGLAIASLVVRLRGGASGRWLLGAALAVILLGAPLCIVALYLPIFGLADAVR